jgi:hypothetical protein
MAIYHPPTFINAYLRAKLQAEGFGAVPLFPTMPTDLAAASQDHRLSLTDLITSDNVNLPVTFQGLAGIYDRMFRMRKTAFPHIKCEQVLYYFYSIEEQAVPKLIELTQHVQDLLDNGDESAEDLNTWAAAKQASSAPLRDNSGNVLPLPYFHSIKIYQLQETRDIVDFATARTYAGNKIIIDYDWHKSE